MPGRAFQLFYHRAVLPNVGADLIATREDMLEEMILL